jgi:hypothetical protein
VEFIEGEFGDNYDIGVLNDDATPTTPATPADLSGFIGGTNILVIATNFFNTPPKLNTPVSIIAPSTARWVMAQGQTDFFGKFQAMLFFSQGAIERKTKPMTVTVTRKAPTS